MNERQITPRLALLFVHNGPKRDGASNNGEGAKKTRRGLFKFVTPAPKMKGNDSPDRGNTNHNHAT